jgi:hypothetical protein
MRIVKCLGAAALFVASALGQVVDRSPTYIGAGAAFNQIGTPRVTIWATAIYPIVSRVGLYSSTTTDIMPVLRTDAATGREYYGFSTSVRQGIHKTVLSSGRFHALAGGDAGVEFSQSAPTGVAVAVAGSITGTAVYQLSQKWAVVVPIRALWQNGAWNLVPEVGIVWKP